MLKNRSQTIVITLNVVNTMLSHWNNAHFLSSYISPTCDAIHFQIPHYAIKILPYFLISVLDIPIMKVVTTYYIAYASLQISRVAPIHCKYCGRPKAFMSTNVQRKLSVHYTRKILERSNGLKIQHVAALPIVLSRHEP